MDENPKKILIAESNQIDRSVLSHRLRIIGYEVVETSNCEEAKAEIDKAAFDLILIDTSLKEISGIELLKMLKQMDRLSNTPILMIAKSNDMNSAIESLKHGANDYILKPFNLELVRSRIQIWLEKNRRESTETMGSQILIVDDNEMNRDMLSRRLKKLGYKVDTAIDGIDGINKATSFNYDLMLLDIMMPNVDGFEVLEKLKGDENPIQMPIIMLTALNDTENILKATQLGAEDYLVKPFNIDQVKQRIHACLSKYK